MQRLCKSFEFNNRTRSGLTFSDSTKIRLNSETNTLELAPQDYGRTSGKAHYSLDTDLTVTTWTTNPDTLRKWLMFDIEPIDLKQPAGTSVKFKLNDGTDDYFWDGGAWSVAGATDWNTCAEVSANIATFSTTTQTLAVVVNLSTTDRTKTPTVERIDLLMECQIDYYRSIVADSVIPSLREGMRFRLDYAVNAAGGSIVSLKDVETEFNIVEIEGVYLDETDPNHATSILSSYDPATKNITLTVDADRGATLFIEALAEPEIYLNWSSQDYVEVEKIPAVVIDNFTANGNQVWGMQCVRDMVGEQASIRRSPFRLRIEFDILLLAEKNRTLLAMMDTALQHSSRNRLINWRGVDEPISLTMLAEGAFSPSPNLYDKHEARYTVRLDDICLWTTPEEMIPLVKDLQLSLLLHEEHKSGSRFSGVRLY